MAEGKILKKVDASDQCSQGPDPTIPPRSRTIAASNKVPAQICATWRGVLEESAVWVKADFKDRSPNPEEYAVPQKRVFDTGIADLAPC